MLASSVQRRVHVVECILPKGKGSKNKYRRNLQKEDRCCLKGWPNCLKTKQNNIEMLSTT